MSARNKKNLTKKKAEKKHSLAFQFRYTLQIIVILDFLSQIICQMPFINLGYEFSKFGFRKIWDSGEGIDLKEAFDFKAFISKDDKY